MKFETLHLLYFTTVVCAAIAFFQWYAAAWIAGVCVLWIGITFFQVIRGEQDKNFNTSFSAVIFVVFAGGTLLLHYTFFVQPGLNIDAQRRVDKLRAITYALEDYMRENGSYPSPKVSNSIAEPGHSWRVAVLPYLGEDSVFKKYSFGEPWNSPNNRKLIDQLSSNSPFYTSAKSRSSYKTPFKLVKGEGTMFESDNQPNPHALRHGASQQILLVEDNSTMVNWMQPEDLTIEQVKQLFDAAKSKNGFKLESSLFETTYNFFFVSTFDAHTMSVGYLNNPDEIDAFFRFDSPRIRSLSELQFIYPDTQHAPKMSGFFLLLVNFLLAVLPTIWPRLRFRY